MSESAPSILALVRDLMFSGRILAEARAAGVAIQMIRDPAQMEQFAQSGANLLIVDLNLSGAVDAAATWRKLSEKRSVVGFVAHTDAPMIARAKQAGLDQVLTRGKFVQVLSGILREAGGQAD